MNWLRRQLNLWVVLGALGVAGVLLLSSVALLAFLRPADNGFVPEPALTLIPAPTPTFTPDPALSWTPTAAPTVTGGPGAIQLNSYVQINGTEGAGLRIRSGPGINSPQLFLGMDAEVFQVKDGPHQADGYQWWYLVAPYDEKRSGWAAANFLSVVSAP